MAETILETIKKELTQETDLNWQGNLYDFITYLEDRNFLTINRPNEEVKKVEELRQDWIKVTKEGVKEQLEFLQQQIENERDISSGELAFLQSHKQEVLEMGDVRLAEASGITEQEWNEGKLNEPRQIIITVYNEEDFHNALGEIKSNLDYDNIEYDYEIK